jgi:hypothetical protein
VPPICGPGSQYRHPPRQEIYAPGDAWRLMQL